MLAPSPYRAPASLHHFCHLTGREAIGCCRALLPVLASWLLTGVVYICLLCVHLFTRVSAHRQVDLTSTQTRQRARQFLR